jgi:DNA-binding CsgD family transcriptional regulator
MLIPDPSFRSDHLATAVEVASAITALPAVGTQDWCQRAAVAVRSIHPQSIVCVTLASIGARGQVLQLEASGAVGSDPFGRQVESDLIHPEHAANLDWWIHEEGVKRDQPAEASLLSGLRCADRWPETGAGRRWTKLGVTDMIVGVVPMAGVSHGRALAVEIAPVGGKEPSPAQVSLLRAVLPLLARRAALAFGPEVSTALTRLTQREQQVLEHLALGKSVKEIAADLSRSPHTVHDHVKSLHRKLNASSRGELIARALGHLTSCGRKDRLQDGASRPFAEPQTAVSQVPTLMSA